MTSGEEFDVDTYAVCPECGSMSLAVPDAEVVNCQLHGPIPDDAERVRWANGVIING